MIERIKRLFKLKRENEAEGAKLTLNDLPPCDFLKLDSSEQNNILIKDGYFDFSRVANTTITPDEFGKVDPRMKGLGLPVETSGIKAVISLQEEDLIDTYTVNESVTASMYEFFRNSLSEIIDAEMFILNNQLKDYLSKVEEDDKRKYARGFFNDVFNSFNYDKIFFTEPVETLPWGVESTNILSKLWMFENHFRQTVFKEERELIIRFLYCKPSLQVPNIHAYHSLLSELVHFIARKNIMLEVNEKYNFEYNHPYTFIHSNGLVFENFSDLFANEIDFDWTIDLLISQDKPIPPKFYHRLADALFQENAFLLSSPFTEFTKLINKGFSGSLTRIRPSENTSDDAKNEINEMKISLNQHRQEDK